MTSAKLAVRNFSSVKLPESLVQQAKDAAQPLRRSAAGQIEYWATLGRVVEHSGLTVQEARFAIENYEAATHKAQASPVSFTGDDDAQANDLMAQFMAIETDGSLARQVRQIVADNRSKALRFAA